MNRPSIRSGENSPASGRESSAIHQLEAIQSTCSHDLPNQILSLQSLINLMDMDVGPQLSSVGHEYLRRLKAVAEKTATVTDYLKAMARLSRTVPNFEMIDLAELFRELKAEIRSTVATPLKWESSWQVSSVKSDSGLLIVSLGEILRLLAGSLSPQGGTVTMSSIAGGLTTTVEVMVAGVGLNRLATAFANRPEFLLARERLRIAGVAMKPSQPSAEAMGIFLEFSA